MFNIKLDKIILSLLEDFITFDLLSKFFEIVSYHLIDLKVQIVMYGSFLKIWHRLFIE